MHSHDCVFSIMRLQANYQGTRYELNECEQCGALGLLKGVTRDRYEIAKNSAQFEAAVDFFDFLIRAVRRS